MPSVRLDDEPIGLLYVTLESGGEAERSCYVLTRSVNRVKIGRHPSCDVQIQNASVSRDHCAILVSLSSSARSTYHEYEFEIEDTQSFNKTKVNGQVVDREMLQDGDEIQAGIARLRFCRLAL